MKLIHLTDTHLVQPGRALHGRDPCARLEACVRHIAEHHSDAAFCILTGDVADAGEPGAYDAARRAIEQLPMPVYAVPGNHDERSAFLESLPQAPRDPFGYVQNAIVEDGAHFLLLDTLEPSEGSGGAYCERRCDWLAQRLAEAGQAPVFVFMHHPPFTIGIPTLDAIGLRDPAPFTRVVKAAGNVRHIFFGHVHRPVCGQWEGISFSTLYGTNHQTRLDFTSLEDLAYTAEPPAYGVVLIESTKVVVHSCHFMEDDADIRSL